MVHVRSFKFRWLRTTVACIRGSFWLRRVRHKVQYGPRVECVAYSLLPDWLASFASSIILSSILECRMVALCKSEKMHVGYEELYFIRPRAVITKIQIRPSSRFYS